MLVLFSFCTVVLFIATSYIKLYIDSLASLLVEFVERIVALVSAISSSHDTSNHAQMFVSIWIYEEWIEMQLDIISPIFYMEYWLYISIIVVFFIKPTGIEYRCLKLLKAIMVDNHNVSLSINYSSFRVTWT